jgi:hypothetical protein
LDNDVSADAAVGDSVRFGGCCSASTASCAIDLSVAGASFGLEQELSVLDAVAEAASADAVMDIRDATDEAEGAVDKAAFDEAAALLLLLELDGCCCRRLLSTEDERESEELLAW